MLLLKFDTEQLPKRLVFDYEITRVYEYRPKIIACYNCHGLGHIARYCPAEEVCKECGRLHSKDTECDQELFCVACQKPGHISINSACPSRVPKEPKENKQNPDAVKGEVTWADKARQNSSTETALPPVYQQQLEELRKENQQLREMLEKVLARLPPEQDVHASQTQRQHASASPTGQMQRVRSKSRPGRSSSRKTTANSIKHQHTETSLTQTPKTHQTTKALTAQDSAYAQMLSIMRQERHNETQRLEKSLRDEFQTITNAIQTQIEAIFIELHKSIQHQNDEPKRRKPAEAQ